MTATQNFAQPVLQEVEPPPLLKMAFACFCIYLAASSSRFFEWKLTFLHVPMITSVLAFAGAAMEGRLAAVFSSKIGMCMSVLTVLYTINVPLSTWRSGSLVVYEGWLNAVVLFAIAGSLVFNTRQCRTALHAMGWATGIAGVLVNWQGKVGPDGRLAFMGTFSNPNSVAGDLLFGLPFLWLILKDPAVGNAKKALALCLMAVNFLGIVRTGSRGGLIGFVVLCFLFFIRSSLAAKLTMALAGFVIVAGAFAVMPHSLKVRYTTLISGSEAMQEVETRAEAGTVVMAESSATERRRLLIASIQTSLSHPLLGVGIGQFGTYQIRTREETGQFGTWQGTHNTYTQISSEAGFPALIAFVCMMVFCVQGSQGLSKRAKRLQRPEPKAKAIIDIAYALTATVIVYAVSICFDYVGYSSTLPLVAGFVIALMRCGGPELERLEREPPPQSPDPFLNLYTVRGARGMRPAVLRQAPGESR